MYVCLCNGFTDRCVDRAVAGGASTPAQVYTSIGVAPQCGRCITEIRLRIKERRTDSQHEPVGGVIAGLQLA